MATIFKLVLLLCVLLAVTVSSDFIIRLWPFNERETEGFLENYYEGQWGFIGDSDYRFDELTASVYCKKLNKGAFGYGGIWTPLGSYTGFVWLDYLNCRETNDTITCYRSHYLDGTTIISEDAVSYGHRYGSSLHCIDSRLINGETYNGGILQTDVSGTIYTVCFDDFDMNAAEVACNHLGFDGAVSFSAAESDATPIYNKQFICNGTEYSLSQCNQSKNEILTCRKIVQLTCKAVRLTSTNEYTDEGAVEIFYNGTWGFVGTPGFVFSEQTAQYLCNRFGFGLSGFGGMAHPLEDYDRIAWSDSLECLGNEQHVMQCDHNSFYAVPPLKHTYGSGSWLYCFDFNITNVRLVNGSSHSNGRVELEINGRWGSICTIDMSSTELSTAGNILCQTMGYRSGESAYGDTGNSTDLFWMNHVHCSGSEKTISDCTLIKGSSYSCYNSPTYMRLTCNDPDDCESDPCVNGGVCIDALNGYTCECLGGWGGVNCDIDIEDNCALAFCFNGATCVDRAGSFQCLCVDGFDGDMCQNNIDECELTTCQNGGSCEDRVNGYMCYCKDGFEGIQCQIVVTDQTILIVILSSAASFLLILTVVVICCCLRYRRNKANKQKSNSNEVKTTEQSDGTDSQGNGCSNVYIVLSDTMTDYSTVKDEDDEDIYNVIKDTDVRDANSRSTLNAQSKLQLDKHGYLSFDNDQKETVRYNKRRAEADDVYSLAQKTDVNNELRDSYLTPEYTAAPHGIVPNVPETIGHSANAEQTHLEEYDDIDPVMYTIKSNTQINKTCNATYDYNHSQRIATESELGETITNTELTNPENDDDIESSPASTDFRSEITEADLNDYDGTYPKSSKDGSDDIVSSPSNSERNESETSEHSANAKPTDPEDYDDVEPSMYTIQSNTEIYKTYMYPTIAANEYNRSPCTVTESELVNPKQTDPEDYDDVEPSPAITDILLEIPDAEPGDYDNNVPLPTTTVSNLDVRDT